MRLTLISLLIVVLGGCSSIDVQEYADRTPKLTPERFFQGKICADGVVRDFTGKQIRSFQARIDASWSEQGVGTLDEVFRFQNDDGSYNTETRIWTLKPNPDGGYQASARDVPEPTTMEYAGNAIHMVYGLEYGEADDSISLSMNDWMYQVREGVVINETRMSKWGIDVGQILLVMRQVSPNTACIGSQ